MATALDVRDLTCLIVKGAVGGFLCGRVFLLIPYRHVDGRIDVHPDQLLSLHHIHVYLREFKASHVSLILSSEAYISKVHSNVPGATD